MRQSHLFSANRSLTDKIPLEITDIICKTIISKSKLYDIDFSINPYVGCQHNCIYCFARSMFERRNMSRQWGQFVDVKINAPAILQKQLRRIRRGTILVSSVTDPYQPIEQQLGLTRRLLSLLSRGRFQIFVLTKSALVSRDIDIFCENPQWEIGLTLTTADDGLRALIEPEASPVEERLSALRTMADAGVTTYAFLGPMLPFLSEDTTSELLDTFIELGVSHIIIDRLNLKRGNIPRVVTALKERLPCEVKTFTDACKSASPYFSRLKVNIRNECMLRGLNHGFCY